MIRLARFLVPALVLVLVPVFNLAYGAGPSVPAPYHKYFVKYSDEPTFFGSHIAPLFGTKKVGRSFALVAGIWDYSFDRLDPAKKDIEALTEYLLNEEEFDEIVVLTNEAVTYDNFNYFLQSYFRDRVGEFPQSRFLFAYSGHGFLDGRNGHLVLSKAATLRDMQYSLGLDILHRLVKRVFDKAHHTLVLLNACNAGAFLKSFGKEQYVPRKRGAHAITAGGTEEETYHISSVGPGSVFFEVLLDGVRGAADSIPNKPDGIVTTNELYGYLHSRIAKITDAQVPQHGDLRPGNDISEGSFFFLEKDMVDRPDRTAVLDNLKDAILFGATLAIDHLYAEPPVIVRGQKVTVKWGSAKASNCSFGDNDVVYDPSGERELRPTSTTELQLKCSDGKEQATGTLKLTVLPPPVIDRFEASKLSLEEGDETRLSWATKNAEGCVLDNGIGDVGLNGTVLVRPRAGTTYNLFCSTQGVEKNARVRVEVRERQPECRRDQEVIGGECVDRCDENERWTGSRCVARCDEDERWTGSRCIARCAQNERWDGFECVLDGLPPGSITRPCGCWGYATSGSHRAPECASRWAEVVPCYAYCPAGGFQWGIRCL